MRETLERVVARVMWDHQSEFVKGVIADRAVHLLVCDVPGYKNITVKQVQSQLNIIERKGFISHHTKSRDQYHLNGKRNAWSHVMYVEDAHVKMRRRYKTRIIMGPPQTYLCTEQKQVICVLSPEEGQELRGTVSLNVATRDWYDNMKAWFVAPTMANDNTWNFIPRTYIPSGDPLPGRDFVIISRNAGWPVTR